MFFFHYFGIAEMICRFLKLIFLFNLIAISNRTVMRNSKTDKIKDF